MKRLLTMVLVALVMGVCGSVSAAETVPLPPVVDVVKPGPEVSAEYAKFSGEWSGKWDNGCPLVIVVESIDNLGRAKIVLAQGSWPWNGKGKNPNNPFWLRLPAHFLSDKMMFERTKHSLYYESYISDKDGTMIVNRTDTRSDSRNAVYLNSAKLTKTK